LPAPIVGESNFGQRHGRFPKRYFGGIDGQRADGDGGKGGGRQDIAA
jgi:hypothetical protein